MNRTWLLRGLFTLVTVLIVGWVAWHIRWVEVEVDDETRGAAATDEVYSLRHVLEGAGATLETRTSLEPLPPADATLVLDSSLWNIFPERDARLKAWVENGGHLVLYGLRARDSDDLKWVPLSFAVRHAKAKPKDDDDDAKSNDDTDDDAKDGDDDDKTRRRKREDASQDNERRMRKLLDVKHPWDHCTNYEETAATTTPAFEPGRVYRGCTWVGAVRPLHQVQPTWQLTATSSTLAMRVPVGKGDVTGVSWMLMTDNRGLLQADNGLIAAAVLQAAPGRAVWIVGDEAREPLMGWLWHEGRTPFLLVLAGIALALWRLMIRFGPREAVPPQARRSMGEQVRGTGQFIAGTDSRALHAATRKAFDEVARVRVENWATLEDEARVEALARTMAPTHALDKAALLASFNLGGGATPVQILAAIAVLEQTRRALLRSPIVPFAN